MRCPHRYGGELNKPGRYAKFSRILVFIAFLVLSLTPAAGRDDPVEVLCLVASQGIPHYQQVLRKEPMFDVTYMPTNQHYGHDYHPEYSDREVRRFIRRYFPRSYEDLTENYEFILILSSGISTAWEYFSDQQIEMMRRGIEEGGLGALKDATVSLEGWWRSEQWAGLSLSDAFPEDFDALLAEDDWSRWGRGRIVINNDPSLPPVLKPYRNLTMCGYHHYHTQMGANLMIPRQGSQTYAWYVNDAFSEYAYPESGWIPYVLGWRYGEGYTWSLAWLAFGGFFTTGELPERHPDAGTYLYGHDASFGLVMYGAGRDPPLDVVLVHEIRERFGEYADATAYISSMIDFIAKFDFNINPMLVKSNALLERWREGRRLYMAQEYDESYTIMDHLTEDVGLFIEEVLAFKDKALFWVYITEWVAVTGTFLLAGFFLWTLMVSRRFYRKIDQTRLRPPEEASSKCPRCTGHRPWRRETGEYSQLGVT